ncbi:BAR domain-containing family protein [Tricharina praecox]|uniref:BAR domain-containing family protein n=1 Tax=Tricharina praecox TaxID=43433 RepID=UPI0022205175|nr:BAR domain-containing family protein [Tricharina praecox]KAI5848809.1 BAR domain-containing family protein [Tricharina praecox]
MDMSRFQNIGTNITASFSPFAARTGQFVREQFGQAEDKTQLPADYLELEKRVDALKQVHQQLLSVTSQYANESYDYPPNLRESFLDLSRTVSEKVQLLASASSAAEAQSALTKPGTKSAPKTFNHALGRASLTSAHLLEPNDPLATALEKYALASEQVGEARLQQDAQIVSRFNSAFTTTLNTNITFAQKARKNVENARLTLDAAKSSAKNGGFGFPAIGAAGRKEHTGDENLTEAQRVEIETAEDEFVGCTEEAVGVMKNVLDTPEPLRNLADLVQAQLEFHKKAFEIYSELAPLIDSLQVEQEASYRKAREEGA